MCDKSVLDIEAIIAPMLATHKSGVNQTMEWRLKNLRRVHDMLIENWQAFIDALYCDLRKEKTESEYTEIIPVINEIKLWQKNLKQWMKPIPVSSPAGMAPAFAEIRSKPLCEPGCLVIAPFNYPVFLSLCPIVGMLGAGNPVVLKPSELCRTVSSLFAKLVPNYFDKGSFQVVEGAVSEATELLKTTWGLVFFTGSERVGRIVAQNAARTLSPFILELGGKSPTYIADDCPTNMRVICDRLAWAKLLNAGQTCVAPDYVVCHESKVKSFCREFQESVERMFTKHYQMKSELPRIVSIQQAQRHVDMLQEIEAVHPEAILFGGSALCNAKEKFVSPTLVLSPPISSKMMIEEIFGPILVVISVQTDDQAISFIRDMVSAPLLASVTAPKRILSRYDLIAIISAQLHSRSRVHR